MSLRAQVLEALGTVFDPELDEPITALGFVGACAVSADGDVSVRLRLPTPQCAPNFAFLMASDARVAVRRVPGVGEVLVALEDHYTGDEINRAVACGGGLDTAFPGETEDALDALRDLFRHKALTARQARLHAELTGAGAGDEEIAALRVRDLPDSPEARRCLELRSELGLPAGADAPAVVGRDGEAIGAADLTRWLRRARLVSLSLESNGGLCRSLLSVRYGAPDQEEVPA